MKKVLIVEDDINLGTTIAGSLEIKKMNVCYSDGQGNVLDIFEQFQPNIVLLDVLMDGKKAGFEIARKIRLKYLTPIIFITALDAPEDLKKAFSFENIDFINKPFNIMEVLLRINKLLSHQCRFNVVENFYQLGSFSFYPDEHALKKENVNVHLNNCETAVLTVLCQHINLHVSRIEIISIVWGVEDWKVKEGSLNNIISSLRKRFAEEPGVKIESVIKLGVRLTMEF
jgi:DNA-binding response OmpR family regulator